MNHFFFVIVLLHFSLATAVNFTQVFEWPDGMDYVWPSEANRTNALNDRTFNPKNIEPIFMAVYGTRIFLSLEEYENIPVTLVSLPTSSASSASPKLTPFPSWEMHGKGDCNKIEVARGLEVDSVGRLWVLETGNIYCNAKLWIFDLTNDDHTNLIYSFPFYYRMHDLVLDETPNETLAFISHMGLEQIVVFSLETNQSWVVKMPGIEVLSIALSPKEEPRQLYVSYWNSYELYTISITALRNGTQTAYPEQIGKWTRRPYRMLIDSHGTMYAAFWQENCIISWNTSQPFEEQRFYEVGKLNIYKPFTFALDSSGAFWMTELNKTATKPRYRLLMAAVGAKSYNFEHSSVTTASLTTTTISPKSESTPVSLSIPTTTTMKPELTPVTATTLAHILETTEIVQESNASSTKLPELNHTTPINFSIPTTTTKTATTPESTPATATTSTQIHKTTETVENFTQQPELHLTTPVSLSIPTTSKYLTPSEKNAKNEVQENCILTENSNGNKIIIITLICIIMLLSLIILWLLLGPKMINLISQNTNEAMQMPSLFDYNEDIGPAEVQLEAVVQPRPSRLVRRFISAHDLRESDKSEAEDVQ